MFMQSELSRCFSCRIVGPNRIEMGGKIKTEYVVRDRDFAMCYLYLHGIPIIKQ